MIKRALDITCICVIILCPILFIRLDSTDEEKIKVCDNICAGKSYILSSMECVRNRRVCHCENYPGDVEKIYYPGPDCDE
jgi:hypothetical protein